MNILKVLSGKAVAASYYYGVNENCRCKVCKMCTFRASKRQLPHLNIDGIKLTKIVFFFVTVTTLLRPFQLDLVVLCRPLNVND